MSSDQVQETVLEVKSPVTTGGTHIPTRAQREELKKLSQEIFGASSKWKKFLDNGTKELVTMKKVETVPGENGAPDTQKEVDVPILFNGVKQYRQKYYTVESLLELFQGLKKKRDEFMAMIKKQNEEAQAKKLAEEQAKKVQDELGGSALGKV